ASSSRMTAARASCSCAESFAASAKASSSSFVIKVTTHGECYANEDVLYGLLLFWSSAAERRASGAAGTGSQARAHVGGRRLRPLVRLPRLTPPRRPQGCAPRFLFHNSCSTIPRRAPASAYWITSSACKRMVGGIVIPSALAVLRLRTSSYFMG